METEAEESSRPTACLKPGSAGFLLHRDCAKQLTRPSGPGGVWAPALWKVLEKEGRPVACLQGAG